jgi:hypothetical protein
VIGLYGFCLSLKISLKQTNTQYNFYLILIIILL